MKPHNKVKPAPEVVEQLRIDIQSGKVRAVDAAAQMNVNKATIWGWIRPETRKNDKSSAVPYWQKDPAGFDAACMLIVGKKSKVDLVMKAWKCGHLRINQRIFELTGIKKLPPGPKRLKVDMQVRSIATTKKSIAEHEKRARLRAEVERLSGERWA